MMHARLLPECVPCNLLSSKMDLYSRMDIIQLHACQTCASFAWKQTLPIKACTRGRY